jgi:CBS domain-containing protein
MRDIESSSLQLPEAAASAQRQIRLREEPPYVRLHDPAARVMSDFADEAPRVVDDERGVQEALDEMFRGGVRAFLVIHGQDVVGFVTADQLLACSRGAEAVVGEIMTPADDAPLIDWHTVCEARVCDLCDIFAGAGVDHLVVVEADGPARNTVRGLINRYRLIRQLRPLT